MSHTLEIPCPHCSTLNRLPAARLEQAPNCGRCKKPLFTGHPIALDEANFHQQVVRSQLPVVVDFWAAWCGPCKMMAPIFEQAAARMEPRVRFAKLDTEANQALAARFAIRSIPTLVLFRNGQEVARQAGVMQGEQLSHWIRSHL